VPEALFEQPLELIGRDELGGRDLRARRDGGLGRGHGYRLAGCLALPVRAVWSAAGRSMVDELKIPAWGVAPEHLDLGPGEVHVWHAKLNARFAQEGLPVLSRAERREMKRHDVAKHFAGGRYLVRALLGRYLRRNPAKLRLRAGPDHRLELDEAGAPHFDFAIGAGRGLLVISASHRLALGVDFLPDDMDVSQRMRDMPPRQVRMAEFLSPESRVRAVVGYQAEVRAAHRLARYCGHDGQTRPSEYRVERLRIGDRVVAALAVEGWDWSSSFWSYGGEAPPAEPDA
jgi:hypothetical protein